jgi:hypothetical protein
MEEVIARGWINCGTLSCEKFGYELKDIPTEYQNQIFCEI